MSRHRERPSRRVNPSGKVVWIARYTTAGGRRLSAGTFARQGPCRVHGRDDCCAQHAIDAAYLRPIAGGVTVGEYADVWLSRHPRSERTNETNRGRVRAVLPLIVDGRQFREWPMRELRRRHLVELVDEMFRRGRTASGATNILRTLSAMFEDAITDDAGAELNPARGVRVRRSDPRAGRNGREPALVLPWDDMHRFAAEASTRRRVKRPRGEKVRYEYVPAPEFEPMLRMLADCGLRLGELFALRRDLQDFDAGVFTVKGTAWNGQIVESSETKQHDRQGPIPPTLLRMLRMLPEPVGVPWLFPTRTGRLWQVNNFYRDVWTPTRTRSGIDCRPHDFRHSYVSLLATRVDAADLADMAGHSVETAQRSYRHALRRSFDTVKEVVG